MLHSVHAVGENIHVFIAGYVLYYPVGKQVTLPHPVFIEILAGDLLYGVESLHESVPVHEKLAGRIRYLAVVLQIGKQHLQIIRAVDPAATERYRNDTCPRGML